MKTGCGWAATGQLWLPYVLVSLAAFCVAAAAAVAVAIGWLTLTVAILLSCSAAGMAMLSILLFRRSDRLFRQHFMAVLQAAEVSERQARAQKATQSAMADSLQQAGTAGELAQRLLSGLAAALGVQQGLCCYWDEESQQLRAAARYAGEGADARAVLTCQPLLAPLLLEAAHSRREIVIASPGASYLRISSGLGDAEPAELLVLPLEYRGRLVALLELAALQPVADAARVLLHDLVPVFALCLDTLSRTDCVEARPARDDLLASRSRVPS